MFYETSDLISQTGLCACPPPPPAVFDDPNSDRQVCCNAGYRFVAANGFEYNMSNDRCVNLSHRDRFDQNSELRFWQSEEERVNADPNYSAANRLNTDRVWQDKTGTMLPGPANNEVQGSCVCLPQDCAAVPVIANGSWSTSQYSEGESTTFSCNSGYELMQNGAKITSNQFTTTCQKASQSCGNTLTPAPVNLSCLGSCDIPADVAHGKHTILNRKFEIYSAQPMTMSVGDIAQFQCDFGYSAYISGTDTLVDQNNCSYCHRECYLNNQAETVIDPLFCDCRPNICPPFEVPEEFQVEDEASDQLVVTCNQAIKCMSETEGYCVRETLKCVDGVWETPTTVCKRTGCQNPRTIWNNAVQSNRQKLLNFNFGHTYASLDSIKISADADNVSLAALTESEIDDMFAPDGVANNLVLADEATVLPGATFTVVCKKGSSPYLAFQYLSGNCGGNNGLKEGSTCEAVCDEDGQWVSNCECLCLDL